MATEIQLRTAAWYGDELFALPVPPEWDVTVFRPRTPPPLTDAQIEQVLESPCGQPPLRILCRNLARRARPGPLVIVDDLNRPTPVARVMPFVLKHFQSAGIAARDVRILLAPGTHGASRPESVRQKVGPEAAAACQVLIHDPHHGLVTVGKTSFGTPVSVNREVAASELVVGIGGVYPNRTAGFGGGSKLALGVLGYRSIMRLHCYHRGLGWGGDGVGSELRKDLDEIARMIGLKSLVCLHIDADRQVIRLACGDHFRFYPDEVDYARQTFTAPEPEGADVVISNAYPNDLSLTFARKKGTVPLSLCPPGASRIAVAACSEGLGFHGLFPYLNRPPFHGLRYAAGRISLMTPAELARKASRRARRGIRGFFFRRRTTGTEPPVRANPVWLYRRLAREDDLPGKIPGVRLASSWEEVVRGVQAEQAGKERLRVFVYPCAPLQCLEPLRVTEAAMEANGTSAAIGAIETASKESVR